MHDLIQAKTARTDLRQEASAVIGRPSDRLPNLICWLCYFKRSVLWTALEQPV
jgi:hypothetical protein